MNNWYEASIKSLIEKSFRDNGYEVEFDSSKSWDSNMKRWISQIAESELSQFNQIAKRVRAYAFDQKYGDYSYATDYRSVCENWNHIILGEIKKALGTNLKGKKVVAVGANNGSELAIIFDNDFEEMFFKVIEISQTACDNGKSMFPNIEFECASMDEVELSKDEYDIFMSLRAAYCAGNNLDTIVKKAVNSVKAGGIIIFSISNGYIDVSNGENIPIKGVYNPENKHCDETETSRNINWMKTAMLANGCPSVTLVDAESEILLISRL